MKEGERQDCGSYGLLFFASFNLFPSSLCLFYSGAFPQPTILSSFSGKLCLKSILRETSFIWYLGCGTFWYLIKIVDLLYAAWLAGGRGIDRGHQIGRNQLFLKAFKLQRIPHQLKFLDNPQPQSSTAIDITGLVTKYPGQKSAFTIHLETGGAAIWGLLLLQWAENIDLLSLLPFSPSDYRRPLYDCFPPSCSGSLELASLLLPSGQLAKTQCCHLPVLCLSRIQLQLSLTCKMELRRVPRDPDDLLWDPTSKKEQEAQRWVCGEPRSLLQCCDIEIWKYESRQVLTARHLLDHRTKNFSSPFFLCDRCSMKILRPWLTSDA